MVQALYEKYRIDFDMFDYNIDEYLKHASESQEEYLLSIHSDNQLWTVKAENRAIITIYQWPLLWLIVLCDINIP